MQAVENTEETLGASAILTPSISEEDVLRAQIFRLIANFLSRQPGAQELKVASELIGDETEFGLAIDTFAKLARQFTPDAAETEYHDLFIGVTRGELLPYGSYYLTGFLNEKPLAILRADMAANNIRRIDGLAEPEDHIASVLEIMAGLVDGTYGNALSLAEQKTFFNKHVNSWAPHFFKDLEKAKYSVLFAPLGTIGRVFMKIEQSAFEMV